MTLSKTDLAASNARVRFAALTKIKAMCSDCGKKRVCSKRLLLCQMCFHIALLRSRKLRHEEMAGNLNAKLLAGLLYDELKAAGWRVLNIELFNTDPDDPKASEEGLELIEVVNQVVASVGAIC